MSVLVHLQEGYETFHPPTWGLLGHFQTSKQKVKSGNQLENTGYQKQVQLSHTSLISGNQHPLAGYLVHNFLKICTSTLLKYLLSCI